MVKTTLMLHHNWTVREGTKGKYQQTTRETANNKFVFAALQKKIRENDGFRQIDNFKYWFHRDDGNVIDRRPK